MPVTRNPGSLTTGPGKKVPVVDGRPSLQGTGLVGAGPNIGQVDEAPPPGMPGQYALETAQTHIEDPHAAHAASAISRNPDPDILWSSNVQGALDELVSTVMKRPPMLGEWAPDTTFSGIVDWGFLKARDNTLVDYGALTLTDATVQDESLIYPYLLQTIGPASDTEFTRPMGDPWTDWQFNTGILTVDGTGWGKTHFGGYVRTGEVALRRTARVYPRPTSNDGATGVPFRVPVTVSGTLFPADRGVLALFHFAVPRAGTAEKVSFLAQPLISDDTAPLSAQGRVVAAVLLGNGILDETCQPTDADCGAARICDGGPGGIFATGSVGGSYDPFAFPGRASGQYGLREIHVGVNAGGDPLVEPWDDLDDDGNPGTSRTATDTIPAPGQVRLGTDPGADNGDVVSYGIPILGGTVEWYDAGSPPTVQVGSLGLVIHGDAIVEDSNFFRYRLPVLKDYSSETGLKWTPKGEVAETAIESSRFFAQLADSNTVIYPDGTAVGSYWRTAGLYTGFEEDCWNWQLARFRQTYLMPSTEVLGELEEVGTYMLVHFKSESDFERFARDGEFPWTSGDEYEVYGHQPVESVEDLDNVANPWLVVNPPEPPNGPATDYGYAANPYHNIRSHILLDPVGMAVPPVIIPMFNWSTDSVPGDEHITWVSGVAYFTPHDPVTGADSFLITGCGLVMAPGFWSSYRTDPTDFVAGVGPALVASQSPVMIATAPWGYGRNVASTLPSSLTVPTNVDPTLGIIPTSDYQEEFRLEVPFTHLGANGGGVFTEANAPTLADLLVMTLPDDIVLEGDLSAPSFSRNAVMRVHFRRPLNHIDPDTTNLPFTAADGHGEVLTPLALGTVLLHTTRFDDTNLSGLYGNFLVAPVGVPPNVGYSQLHRASKDYQEKFLDEVARYVPDTTASLIGVGPYNAATVNHLDGPGMGGWAGGPIETPVRISLANAPWDEDSFLLMEHHLEDVSGPTLSHDALQVAGLPDRNPAIEDVATMPFPSTGILQYPQIDYSTGHFPETGTHLTAAQPDYSAAAGSRNYIRCFDVAFSHAVSPGPVAMAGQSELVLRFDGITLEDLAYAAPGPGGLAGGRIAVALKVPGLTTWMDVGRVDGGGPSKQDALLDGAGCQIAGTETYNFTDPASGYKGCYVKVHVGPAATLFANPALWSSYTASSPLNEVPVLVKVQMGPAAVSYNLEHVATGVGIFEVPSKPGAAPNEVRGLIGMSVVHPDETLLAAD